MKKNRAIIWFIFIHILLIVGLFVFVKTEYHSDEIWSFGVANGSVSGAIFEDGDENPINNHEWISGEVFHENLTVQEEERFNYKIAYKNAQDDVHPPLSFMLIHTISSIFTDEFSFWFYIPFNILALILCDIYMYRILIESGNSKWESLSVCALYAFCAGGVNTMMFIRMYALVTAFATMLFYYSYRFTRKESVTKKDLFILVVLNFLGGLTEYEYYVVAFIIAALTCCFLLFAKKIRKLLQYGISMLVGVVLSLMVFPEFFKDMLSNTNGEGFSGLITYPYGLQLKMLSNFTLRDVIGFGPTVYGTFGTISIVGIVFVYLSIVMIPFFVIFRKDQKIQDRLHKIFNTVKTGISTLCRSIQSNRYLVVVGGLEYIFMLLLLNHMISVYHMREQSVRYYFIVYPVLVLTISILILCVFKMLGMKEKIRTLCYSGFLMVLCICSIIFGNHCFVYTEGLTGTGIDTVKNSNILIIGKNNYDIERVCHIIDSSNYFFNVKYDDLSDWEDEIVDVPEERPIYLVLAESTLYAKVLTKSLVEADEAINVNDTQIDEIMVEEEKKILNMLQDMGLCKECIRIGEEQMLNTKFLYYELKND